MNLLILPWAQHAKAVKDVGFDAGEPPIYADKYKGVLAFRDNFTIFTYCQDTAGLQMEVVVMYVPNGSKATECFWRKPMIPGEAQVQAVTLATASMDTFVEFLSDCPTFEEL